jgi:hypothetical protein
MKTVQAKDKKLALALPPNSRFPIETPDDFFTHHCIMLCVGKRGAGKTTIIFNYLRMLKQANKADRIFCISPTVHSNEALLNALDIDPSDCFDPEDKQVIPKLLAEIDKERDDYSEYLHKMKRYKEIKKVVDATNVPVMSIDPGCLLEFADELGQLVPPKSKYGHRPMLHCFIDDAQSTPLFRDRKFMNALIRHRHLGSFKLNKSIKEHHGALGLSCYIAVQNLKASSGGCPRSVRNNATQLAIVGKSKDTEELDDIYSSVGGEIDYDDFMDAYEYATAEPYNSLVIDLHPKSSHPSRFRKNINEYIVLPPKSPHKKRKRPGKRRKKKAKKA